MNNTTKKIRWGIISTAKIGTEHVIPAVLASKDSELAAIASRDKAKAQKTAKQFKIPKAYGSYEELFKDPDIDAIYNPLPNDMHALFSVQALKAGKHILCEKPAGIKVSELLEVKKHVGDRIFMEAFMVRFHPQWHKALELVKSKKIGDIRAMQVFFSFYNDDPKNIRNILKNGGGAMFDIGCYPLTVSRFIFETEPKKVSALADIDPAFKVDRTLSAIFDYDAGRHLTFTVSTRSVLYQRVNIIGTKGRLEIRIPFNAPTNKETVILFDDGSALDGSKILQIKIPACDQYKLEIEAMNRIIRGEEKQLYGIDDALKNMQIIETVFKAAKSGKWENC